MNKKLIAIAAGLCLLIVAGAATYGLLGNGTLATSIDTASTQSSMIADLPAEQPEPAPVAEEPKVEEPAPAPVAEEPKVEEPAPAPVAEEPKAEETAPAPVAEEPKAEETAPAPVAEEPKAEETASVVEESEVEETAPVAEEPEVEETAPVAEEPEVEETAPVVETPVEDQPVVDQPETEAPAVETPVEEQPAVDQPETDAPAVETPVEEQPAVDQPETDAPAVDTPVEDQPAVDQPETDAPAVETPVEDQPAVDQPETDAPVVDVPVEDQPVEEEPVEDNFIPAVPLNVYSYASADFVDVGNAFSVYVTANGGEMPYQSTTTVMLDGVVMQTYSHELVENATLVLDYLPLQGGAYTVVTEVTDCAGNVSTVRVKVGARDRSVGLKNDGKWENLAKELELTGDWRMDVLLIAQTQLGNTESDTDFIMDAEGQSGYTLYGEWVGNAYADWCAAFIGWCFEQAETGMPLRLAAVSDWVEKMEGYQAFRHVGEYAPEAGDIIFLIPNEQTEIGHIGIVEYVTADVIGTIEANVGNMVDRRTYDLNDEAIGGYASMVKLMESVNVEHAEEVAQPYAVTDVTDFTAYLNTNDTVNLRNGPSTKTMRKATLSGVGTPVTVTAQVESDGALWYLIQCEDIYGEQTGYMMAKFLDGSAPAPEDEEYDLNLDVEEDEAAVEEDVPVLEEPDSAVEMSEEEPAESEAPAAEELSGAVEVSEEETEAAEEPAAEEVPAESEAPAAEENSAAVEVSEEETEAVEEPAAEEVPAESETPAAEELSSAVEVSEEETEAVEEPAAEEVPAEAEAPVADEDASVEAPVVEEEVPAEDESAFMEFTVEEDPVITIVDTVTRDVVTNEEVPAEITEWASAVNADETMIQRALSAPTLDSLVIEGDALIYVRTGKKMATYNAATGELIDDATNRVVAIVDMESGMVYPVTNGTADAE